MADITTCILCGVPVSSPTDFDTKHLHHLIHCPCCGPYWATLTVASHLGSNFSKDQLACLSAFSRQREINGMAPPLFTSAADDESYRIKDRLPIHIDRVLEEHPLPSVSERLDLTLQNLARLTHFPGSTLQITSDHYPLSHSENRTAFIFLLRQLRSDGLVSGMEGTEQFTVTVAGWNRVAELQRGGKGVASRVVFVAMWFDPSMDESYAKGLEPAIKEAGFTPLRIDLKEHNNQITDEIIAGIRQSRFLVADFTGHRHGVYYEAGFMLGLGRPVIFTCRHDAIKDAHFDTRQYNHIVWENSEDLRVKLLRRIKATVP